MQRSALCRSQRELSNEYLLAKIGVDAAENEPLEVWRKIQFIIHLPPYWQPWMGMVLVRASSFSQWIATEFSARFPRARRLASAAPSTATASRHVTYR